MQMSDDFSKYDVYSTCQSIYCYTDSTVLKNKFNITNGEKLKRIEADITFIRQEMLIDKGIIGKFTPTHLKNIHKALFEDIYYFAGKYRKEQIAKSNTMFYPADQIESSLKKLLAQLNKENNLKLISRENFYKKLAYYMAELNAIHPFREGNGRTIREFIRQLCLYNNYIVDWSKCSKNEILTASIKSYDDYTALIPVLNICAVPIDYTSGKHF